MKFKLNQDMLFGDSIVKKGSVLQVVTSGSMGNRQEKFVNSLDKQITDILVDLRLHRDILDDVDLGNILSDITDDVRAARTKIKSLLSDTEVELTEDKTASVSKEAKNWKVKLNLKHEWAALSDAIGDADEDEDIEGTPELDKAFEGLIAKLKFYANRVPDKESYEEELEMFSEGLYEPGVGDNFNAEEFNYRWGSLYDYFDSESIWVAIH